MRFLGSILLLAAPLLAQDTGGAPGADPARLFPADTFAYVEADASAAAECLPQWQIARIIGDPALKVLFGPAFSKLGIDPEKPVESLLARMPAKEFLDGRAAVGVRGASVVVRDGNGREWKFRVSPDAPIDGRSVYRLQGMMQNLMFVPPGGNVVCEIDVDFLAVGRPGPGGFQLVEEALRGIGGEVTREAVKVAGLDGTHLRVEVPDRTGFSYVFNFYAAERDGTWYVGSLADTVAQALSGGPRTSLAASPSLAQARAKLTGGRPVLLAHADLALLFRTFGGFVPPIFREMFDIGGMSSFRGVGLGLSLVDGGMRESLGILLDGDPKGFWRILDGMPAGLRSLEAAPPGALAAFGVKLDPGLLRERIRAYVADVSPGTEDEFDSALSREMAPGFDLVKEVIPALGDEAAVFAFPSGMNAMFPGFVARTAVRDEELFSGIVAKVQALVPAEAARFQPVELPGGIRAVRVLAATPFDMHFAVHGGHFLLASSAKLLGEAAAWGGGACLLRDDPVFPLVLKASGGAGGVAALGYLNLRGGCNEALKMQVMWTPQLPPEWIDPRGLAELRRIPNHLTGAAIVLRHDEDAVVLDCFSPLGLLLPAIVAGVAIEGPAIAAPQVIPQPEGTGRPSLGINTKSSDGTGVKVLALAPQGAAAAAGLQQGDKVIGFDGVAIGTMEDLDRELEKRRPGDSVELTIRRGDTELTITVELGEEESGW